MHMTKDMAGKNPINYSDIFNEQEVLSLSLLDLDFLFNDEYINNIDLDSSLISNKILQFLIYIHIIVPTSNQL